MTIKGIIGLALIILAGYGLLEARHIIAGPSIDIESPAPYASSTDGFVLISGTAHNTETLMLNDGPLLIDEEGRFIQTLLLPRGGAILSLTATDRFGRSTTERRTVYIP